MPYVVMCGPSHNTVEATESWTDSHEHLYSLLTQEAFLGLPWVWIRTFGPRELGVHIWRIFNIVLIFKVLLILLCP